MAATDKLIDALVPGRVPLARLAMYNLTAEDVTAYLKVGCLRFHSILSVMPGDAVVLKEDVFSAIDLDGAIQHIPWQWVQDFKARNVSAQAREARAICIEMPLLMDRMLRAGLTRTWAKMRDALKEVGYEAAELTEQAWQGPEPGATLADLRKKSKL